MKFSKTQEKKIYDIINTYNTFQGEMEEESLYADTVNIYNKELIYSLIFYVGAYKDFGYELRSKALEQLTYHLITETVLPVDYQHSKSCLSPLDLATLINSKVLIEGLTERLNKNKKKTYYKDNKR